MHVQGRRIGLLAEHAAAGQVAGSEKAFTRLTDYRLLLLAGYAIIDHASFPVIGDPKKSHDDCGFSFRQCAIASADQAEWLIRKCA